MAASNVCWGIEIGSGAVKALKLARDGEEVKVEDFVVLPHKRVLSTPELDQAEAIRVALGALTSQHDLSKARIAVGVPGHMAFARFAKLPPVEPKQAPKIIKFEAAQQIPFPLEEVEWDYQTFVNEDSPDVEVGIFAMTRERVMERLNQCADVGLRPDAINLCPVSAYNALVYDRSFSEQTPGTVILDVGTVATDLIVAEAGRVWIRTFPIGGHNFTEALVNAFKLPYSKAEKLKREADQSKHKRHIFQAMRPVFTDLAQDVQRSLSYYQQLHSDADLQRVIGLGSTFKLLGLRKFLSQQLQMEVVRCDQFKRLSVEGPASAGFQSATLSLAPAYGLALQGLDLATIDASLVPTPILRETLWRRKTPWIAAAATLAVAAGGISFLRPAADAARVAQASDVPGVQRVSEVRRESQRLQSQWAEIQQSVRIGHRAENVMQLLQRRDLHAHVVKDVAAMLASADPQPGVLEGTSDLPPEQWRLFLLRDLSVDYVTPSGGAPRWIQPGAEDGRRDRRDRGAGRRGGGGGGLAGPTTGPTGRRGAPSRGRDQDRRPDSPDQPFGALIFTLVVDSTNEGLSAFVDRTLLAWLRENADRSSAPYVLDSPTADEIQIRELSPDQADDRVGRTRDRSGGETGADQGEPTSLPQLAPLPSLGLDLFEQAPVYRYTIQWRARLKEPAELDQSPAGEQTASAKGQTP